MYIMPLDIISIDKLKICHKILAKWKHVNLNFLNFMIDK